jgi:type II secretory pathway pseudopilin PulG
VADMKKNLRFLIGVIMGCCLLLILLAIPALFIDTQSSRRATALPQNLRSTSVALGQYHQTHGKFPENLSEISAEKRDPYGQGKNFAYKRIAAVTREYCEIYTARLETPAMILRGLTDYEFGPEYMVLKNGDLSEEALGEKLPPDAPFTDRILHFLHVVPDYFYPYSGNSKLYE